MAVEFIGKSSMVNSNGSITQTFPTYLAGDLLVLFFSSANQAPANDPATSGYTLIGTSSIGSAGIAGGNRISCWYKFAGSSETAVVLGDSGDYSQAITLSFRGVDTTSPLSGTTTTSTSSAATTFSAIGMTTATNDSMVVHAIGLDADATSAAALTSPVNANLTGLTIRHAQTVVTQSGGGFAMITGIKATAGATGNTTGSAASSAVKTYVTFALRPQATVDGSITSVVLTATSDILGMTLRGTGNIESIVSLVTTQNGLPTLSGAAKLTSIVTTADAQSKDPSVHLVVDVSITPILITVAAGGVSANLSGTAIIGSTVINQSTSMKTPVIYVDMVIISKLMQSTAMAVFPLLRGNSTLTSAVSGANAVKNSVSIRSDSIILNVFTVVTATTYTPMIVGGLTPPPIGTVIKVYIAGVWTSSRLQRWNGVSWVPVTLSRWDGSQWIQS